MDKLLSTTPNKQKQNILQTFKKNEIFYKIVWRLRKWWSTYNKFQVPISFLQTFKQSSFIRLNTTVFFLWGSQRNIQIKLNKLFFKSILELFMKNTNFLSNLKKTFNIANQEEVITLQNFMQSTKLFIQTWIKFHNSENSTTNRSMKKEN